MGELAAQIVIHPAYALKQEDQRVEPLLGGRPIAELQRLLSLREDLQQP
jgi:hypothetical protein